MRGWILAALTGSALAVASGDAVMAEDKTAHAFSFAGIDGGQVALSDYAGQAVLVVNTASRCGFTKQYEGLQALWESHRDRGLVVLGVPSNDFGNQEPGSEDEIKEFCEVNFGVNFPMTEKVSVKGEDAHPFYQWARNTLGDAEAPKWNFHKYLVGPQGEIVASFGSRTTPQSSDVVSAIEDALSTRASN